MSTKDDGPEDYFDVDLEPKPKPEPEAQAAQPQTVISSRYSQAFFGSCCKMIFMLLFLMFVFWLTGTMLRVEELFLGSNK